MRWKPSGVDDGDVAGAEPAVLGPRRRRSPPGGRGSRRTASGRAPAVRRSSPRRAARSPRVVDAAGSDPGQRRCRPSPGGARRPRGPLSVISVSVIPYRSTGRCPVSASQALEHRRRAAARCPTPAAGRRPARAAASGSADDPDHTVGTPKYRLPPAAGVRLRRRPAGVHQPADPMRSAPSTPRTSPCTWNSGSPCTRVSSAVQSQASASASRPAAIARRRAARPWARRSCPRCRGSAPARRPSPRGPRARRAGRGPPGGRAT